MNSDADLSIRQMCEAWRIMCTPSPGHTLGAGSGIEYIFSGLPIAFYNVGLLTEHNISAEALHARGDEACAWASDKGVPWLLIVTHDTLVPGVDSVAVLDACGFAPIMPLTGMIATDVSPSTRVPEGLELTVPRDDARCAAILNVNSAAYGMDLSAGQDLLGKGAYWRSHFPVLALAEGKPVSTATVLIADGHRYVALVATEPGSQRRGYADAAMRRALENAAQAHGTLPTFLHASDAGRPLYERMGYKAVASHMIFIEKRFPGGH